MIFLSVTKHFVHPSHLYAIGEAICQYPANMADMSLDNVTLTSQCFLAERYGYLALTFDGAQNMLYYSSNYTNTISAIPLETGAKAKIVAGGTGTVKGKSQSYSLHQGWGRGGDDVLIKHIQSPKIPEISHLCKKCYLLTIGILVMV